jgi:hypothetical protein
VLTRRHPAAANGHGLASSRIETVTIFGGAARPDGFAIARIRGRDLDPSAIDVQALTAGYSLELLPQCTRHGDDLLFGVQLHRDDARARDVCELRFRAGPSSSRVSVTFSERFASRDAS